ncbi:hypothetical protein S7335_2179 [Synechococcus sp. PCC 7335]|nr:hypothetical protein S7335_2179 [Synechococcus sp. PCC 7335]
MQNATDQNATSQNATNINSTNSNAVILPPIPTSISTPFSPELSGIVDLYSNAEDGIPSIGHLRPRHVEGLTGDSVNWLTSVSLPLYVSPNGAHWGWIHKGYLVQGESALAIGRDAGFAMVKPYENLYTFPVLEIREDGWFQVQYTTGGSAWAHTSQLEVGDIPLVIERWELLLSSQAALYFLERTEAQPLRSQPQEATNMLSFVAADSLIEPISIVGDWMRVRVTRPTLLCEPLTGSTVTEGWMRWRGNEDESLVWYNPDGSCPQTS